MLLLFNCLYIHNSTVLFNARSRSVIGNMFKKSLFELVLESGLFMKLAFNYD